MTPWKLGLDVQRIVWIQTGFLGDIVLTTAALQWVREQYPNVQQLLITTPLGAKALSGHPALDKILVFDKRGRNLWQAAQELRKALRTDSKNTVVLQAHRSARSSLLARIIGLPTVSYEESSLARLARWRVPRVALLHEVQRILLLLEPLGVGRWDFQAALPQLAVAPLSPQLAGVEAWAGGAALIAIAPGSVWGTKRWPQEYYQELATILLQESAAKLVIIGSPDEKAAAECVEMAGIKAPGRIRNLAGKTSLDELRALFPRLRLLISNDSSPLHYASAFRIPTLAIFGATVPALGFGPLAPGSRVAQIELACRPCSDHGPQTCPLGHFRCMREQTPQRIGQIALEMLQESIPYVSAPTPLLRGEGPSLI